MYIYIYIFLIAARNSPAAVTEVIVAVQDNLIAAVNLCFGKIPKSCSSDIPIPLDSSFPTLIPKYNSTCMTC